MGIRFSTLVECDSNNKIAATNGAILCAMECSFISVMVCDSKICLCLPLPEIISTLAGMFLMGLPLFSTNKTVEFIAASIE
jgi:hypothetical protein